MAIKLTFDKAEDEPAKPTGAGSSNARKESPPPEAHSEVTFAPLEREERAEDSISHDEEFDEVHLEDMDIENRSGNYIFTFGKVGSGKTTFQYHLLRWLMIGGEFNTEILPIQESRRAEGIVNEWKRMWEKGKFPAGTARDNPKEFRFRVTPHYGQKTPLEFFFFEMSGEDLASVEARLSGPEPKMMEVMHRFLNNQRIRFSLILICDGDDPEQDDIFISSFLTHLRTEYGDRFQQSAPITLLIAKSDLAIEQMRKVKDSHQVSRHKLNTGAFVDRYMKSTSQALKAWTAGHSIYSFTVGKVETVYGEPHLKRTSYDDVTAIFEHIYKQFTGKSLGKTRWEKFKAFLKSMTE